MKRRTFLYGVGGAASLLVFGGAVKFLDGDGAQGLRPPGGQDEDRFRSLCLRCDKCRTVCPEDCVSVSSIEDGILNARLPILDFHQGKCTFCNECIEACPTGALEAFDPAVDKIGVAMIDPERCIAYINNSCDRCDVCPYDAISFDAMKRPSVDEDACNGCGACTLACTANVFLSFDGDRRRAIEVVRVERGE
ncbi:MAG: 4Fe-4S binding protein [Eggerthellaceae bacterium]|nr:4Fe-4S binding protein [Eggerthellaceae bacterium]